jgi:signal transduction histidine kinase
VRHGTRDAPVRVALEADPQHVTLSVHNGGHIPPELLPRIFEPFQTSRESRAKAGGLGLGLYIVQQIVFAHSGSIEVCSNPAQGTEFKVQLPRISHPKSEAAD